MLIINDETYLRIVTLSYMIQDPLYVRLNEFIYHPVSIENEGEHYHSCNPETDSNCVRNNPRR